MSGKFAIYTFDFVQRKVPVGSGMPTQFIDCVLFENCPDTWDASRCAQRAARLEASSGNVFIVRHKVGANTWSNVSGADWKRGRAAAERQMREVEARNRQKRIQQRISKAGMPPPKGTTP